MRFLSATLMLAVASLGQGPPPGPNVEQQKAAMRKLEFLVGKWSGDATVAPRGPGSQPMTVRQTEDIQFRLGGLVLAIEGIGRDPESGRIIFHAFAVVSYDEATSRYDIRAYADGRRVDAVLETDGAGFAWGFPLGQSATIRHNMRVTPEGDWHETTMVRLGDSRELKSVEMRLKKER